MFEPVSDVGLTPLQQRTWEALKRTGDPVVFDRGFIDEFTGEFASAIDERAALLSEDLYLSKSRVANLLGCEVQYLEEDNFAWNPNVAGGQIAHRAIQLMLHWRGDPAPADLVDEAVARLSDETTSLGEWVAGLSEADRADLRQVAVDKVIKYQECFPPIESRFAPQTESMVRWPTSGRITLAGKADLTIGRPRGAESYKLIIDLKTGRFSHQHAQDLRFYALIETMRSGLPPRKLATFYLDSGEAMAEDVSQAVLDVAARRTLDAIDAHIDLTVEGRPPIKRPGTSCFWCPLLPDCAEGQAYTTRDDD